MKNLKTLAMATMASSALLMTACQSTNGYNTGINNMSDTTKGALGGAALGALVTSGGNSSNILTGTLAGAALGGAGGYALEKNKENQQIQQAPTYQR